MDFEQSNLFYYEIVIEENHDGFINQEAEPVLRVNWTNVTGLLLRTVVNIAFQSTTMLAFMYAKDAGINQGLITSLFSTYCVFTSFIFFFLFGEKLKFKFLIGISLMLACVVLVSVAQKPKAHYQALHAGDEDNSSSQIAIAFGLLSPFLISIFISVSRYWSQTFNYRSIDFTVDTFMLMGFIEVPFFVWYQLGVGYSLRAIVCGLGASFGQIMGTCLMIYSATYGLAGPSSAMV